MKRISWKSLVVAGGILMGACGQDPAGIDADLLGLWNLPYQETPAIYGLLSAQVIFRPDHTFLFQGLNPTSTAPHGEFTVTGTWSLSGDFLTLHDGGEAMTWRLTFQPDGRLRFTDPETGATFRLFRPLPD